MDCFLIKDQADNLFKYETDENNLTESYFKLVSDVQKIQHEFGKKLRLVLN